MILHNLNIIQKGILSLEGDMVFQLWNYTVIYMYNCEYLK